MEVVAREAIPEITSVVVDGTVHDIGLLKDFHRNPALRKFVPEFSRLSLSWVRLQPDEELSVHQHPTKSMIVVAEGTGRTLGDITAEIRAGDIVVVPSGARHGFIGTPPTGFWALSIQFEGAGLYENPDDPRVSFAGDRPDIAAVRAENDAHLRTFENNALVRLISEIGAHPPQVRDRMLDHLQGWSDAFQRVIAARVVGEGDGPGRALADEHLGEEIGHNRLLARMRDNRPASWDPVIAAISSWFLDRMTSGSSVERSVLSHLVLEGSGLVFHAAGLPSFPESRYFQLHDGADAEHMDMGYRALAEQRDWTPDEVGEMLRKGWQMMELLGERIAECAQRAALVGHA
ncbi:MULTISPECIES: cupin domain-containing protein [unclassified Nocardia]|uniref:cupin domain-containing protein n=1 Tax=unclassified Nocardia TaxID=2637762 RepID=UPI00343BA826